MILARRSLQTQVVQVDSNHQLFHTECCVKDKLCSLIIDGGSCVNITSTEMVANLGLATVNHPKPCVLHWPDDEERVKVRK